MKYLLDTNIVSELMKPAPDPDVVDWVTEHDADTVLCSMVLSELAAGVEAMDEESGSRLGERNCDLSKRIMQSAFCHSMKGPHGSGHATFVLRRMLGFHRHCSIAKSRPRRWLGD